MSPTPLSHPTKTSATAEWLVPLLLWVFALGMFVSMVVAALSS